jgi:GLPGLI family protein
MSLSLSKNQNKTKMRYFFTTALLSFIMIFISLTGSAQKIEGFVQYIKTIDHVKQISAVDFVSKAEIERETYILGRHYTNVDYTQLFLNASQSKYEDSKENSDQNTQYSSRKDVYLITRNFEKNLMCDILEINGKAYIIEDSLHAPKWKILNRMKEIAGHVCMNAMMKDNVKKQKVEAWFALDIKNNGGPERYFGLPGLILEVNVNDGAMIIIADKFDLRKLTTELNLPKKIKGKKIKENDYNNIVNKLYFERRKNNETILGLMRY